MRNRVLVYAEAVDVAAERAVRYARTISGGSFEALHVPGKHSDTGINARWFDLTGGEVRLDIRPAGSDPVEEVVAAVRRLRGSENDGVVTVVVPEQFRKRSLVAATQRAQFRLKLRLLTEAGTVVADVTAVTKQLRPEGAGPNRLVLRVLAAKLDAAARGALDYARLLGVADLRVVRPGDAEWHADELELPVDSLPVDGNLDETLLAYLRSLTADGSTAVNVVLPERLSGGAKQLRSPRTLAIKRALLFEPHVILSSVPHRD